MEKSRLVMSRLERLYWHSRCLLRGGRLSWHGAGMVRALFCGWNWRGMMDWLIAAGILIFLWVFLTVAFIIGGAQ
ncbi:MAG TPA: hypothetical protein PLX49_02180 [Prolixibacteraceae bacterium]|nr:hypothetical protein [Prolixibacteraceae bacterium]